MAARQCQRRRTRQCRRSEIDFVFDRTAEGRVIKHLIVVDDAAHEAAVPSALIYGSYPCARSDRVIATRIQ